MPLAIVTPIQPSRSRLRLCATMTALATSAVLLLSGCADAEPSADAGSDHSLVVEHNLDGLNAREIIKRLDTTKVADRSSELIASIEPDQLVLTDDQNNQTTLPMPEDEFYVSKIGRASCRERGRNAKNNVDINYRGKKNCK